TRSNPTSSSAATCSPASRIRSPTASSSTTTSDAGSLRAGRRRPAERSPMIELTVADGVAEVVLNAPEKLNALDAAALAELSEAYASAERAAEAGDVRALVL